jgi:hypothetical protein
MRITLIEITEVFTVIRLVQVVLIVILSVPRLIIISLFLFITIELLLESKIITRLSIVNVSAVYLEFPRRWSPYTLLPIPLVIA